MKDAMAPAVNEKPQADPVPAPDAPALPRTWEEMFPRRPTPEGEAYGFLSARGEVVASSRERLLHLARTGTLPPLVWTPETAEMVPPWEVPFLLEVMREPIVAAARRELDIARAVLIGFLLLDLLLLLAAPLAGVLVGAVIGGLLGLLVWSISRRVKQGERLSAEEFRRSHDALLAHQAELAQPVPATRAIAAALLAAGMGQILYPGTSLDVGAVSREAVGAGEWWRLFTAPVLHGGILHFWMNYGALQSLGRTMETRGVRAWVPLVFLGSALAGGVFSVALPPEGPSVGASGGLMGMFGFLAVMAYRRRSHMPEGFLRALVINVAVIGLVGVIAYRFIDNAAHAGGLLMGLAVGMAAVPAGDAGWMEARALRVAGGVAHVVIFASAGLAILLTLLHASG